jgi:hypothetical protein
MHDLERPHMNMRTAQASDEGRFFTYDPHRLPFAGSPELQYQSQAHDIVASDLGELTEFSTADVSDKDDLDGK